MLSREATNTNFIVFGLNQLWLELMIYCIRGGHANHYATNVHMVIEEKNLQELHVIYQNEDSFNTLFQFKIHLFKCIQFLTI
jgi:hypothetical protein